MGIDIAAVVTRTGEVYTLAGTASHAKIERAHGLVNLADAPEATRRASVTYAALDGLNYFNADQYSLMPTDEWSGWINDDAEFAEHVFLQVHRELLIRLATRPIPISQPLRLDRWPDAEIPDIRVLHNLSLQYAQVESLREGLNVNGHLNLYGCKKLTVLPASLWMGWGDLHIEHTNITRLPAGLHCNRVFCEGSMLSYIPKEIKVPVYGRPCRQAKAMVDERIDGEIIDYPHRKWYPKERFPLRHMTPAAELEAWDVAMTEEPGDPPSALREELRQQYGTKLNRPDWSRR